MVPKEKLTVLLQSLRGHRKKIYNYVLKENFELAKTDKGAEAVYELIKDRMLEFTETLTEKQTRVQSEFRILEKGNLTARQWEVALEKGLSDLADAGLPLRPREEFLAYIEKCGQRLHRLILGDLKPRRDLDKKDGSLIHREPQTWREAHNVVKSLESIETSARSLQRSCAINVMSQMPGSRSKSRRERQKALRNSNNNDGSNLAQAKTFSQVMAQIMAQGKGKGKGIGKTRARTARRTSTIIAMRSHAITVKAYASGPAITEPVTFLTANTTTTARSLGKPGGTCRCPTSCPRLW